MDTGGESDQPPRVHVGDQVDLVKGQGELQSLSRNGLVCWWSQSLTGAKVVSSGDPTLPLGPWISVLRPLCRRCPTFSWLTLSDLAFC